MARRPKFPVTPAIRQLRDAAVEFEEHLYRYEERGGTRVSSRELGVDEHAVVKTLVFEDQDDEPLLVLMHGDREVAPGLLAGAVGAKRVRPCTPAAAQRHTGYLVGGTSPFGLPKAIPIFVEDSILGLERIWINGGKRGFLLSLAPSVLTAVLGATPVRAAQPER